MKIQVEIFDDGKEPITCCRHPIYADDERCQFLRRYSENYVCGLFVKPLDRYDSRYASVVPCPECMQALQETKDER